MIIFWITVAGGAVAWSEFDEQGNRTEDQAPEIVNYEECCSCD